MKKKVFSFIIIWVSHISRSTTIIEKSLKHDFKCGFSIFKIMYWHNYHELGAVIPSKQITIVGSILQLMSQAGNCIKAAQVEAPVNWVRVRVQGAELPSCQDLRMRREYAPHLEVLAMLLLPAKGENKSINHLNGLGIQGPLRWRCA